MFRLRRRNLPAGADSDTNEHVSNFNGGLETFVGRIYTVIPRGGEQFYLRTLLPHGLGAASFEEMKTVDGEIFTTYCEKCFCRGFLSDDAGWKRSLRDAFRSSFQPLTELFAIILAHCESSSPLNILIKSKNHFSQDLAADSEPSRIYRTKILLFNMFYSKYKKLFQ